MTDTQPTVIAGEPGQQWILSYATSATGGLGYPIFDLCATELRLAEINRGRLVDQIVEFGTTGIGDMRSQLVRKFLEHKSEADWLLMVDTDMTFPSSIHRP
jgi:hypothetical protein